MKGGAVANFVHHPVRLGTLVKGELSPILCTPLGVVGNADEGGAIANFGHTLGMAGNADGERSYRQFCVPLSV